MSRVLITGSADGLGRLAAQQLVAQGHRVVLHARHDARAREAMRAVPGAEGVVTGDLASLTETKTLAQQVNALGAFDAVIHNAAIGYQEKARGKTEEGLPRVFAINTLAPYVLTALIHKPRRLVYLGSTMHRSGDADMSDLAWTERKWNGSQAYSDSKLTTSFWHSRSRASGLWCCQMRSIRDGCRRRWAVAARRTIWRGAPRRRHGSP